MQRQRPANALLQHLSEDDYTAMADHLEIVHGSSDQVLYHPGDRVETAYFPCATTLVSFLVAVEDGRDLDTVLIGREGAVGGIIGRGFAPAYSRVVVRIEGPIVRLSLRRFYQAVLKSPSLREVFARYADCLLGQILQSTACNATHSIEQRAAKWICATQEHIASDRVPLTHEQLAGLLGVARSYASRIMQSFKAAGIIETARGQMLIRDRPALRMKSCLCNDSIRRHFEEALPGIYPSSID